MTYWVENDAFRKIMLGLVVLLVILAVSIPLTVFALNDEETQPITPASSMPAPASPALMGSAGYGNDAPSVVYTPPGRTAGTDAPAPARSQYLEPGQLPDEIDEEVPAIIALAPAASATANEQDLTITVISPFKTSDMNIRLEAVQEGPVWFLPNTFHPAPYIAQGNPETAPFLIWESLDLPAGESVEIQGRVRATSSEPFNILAYVEANTRVFMRGSAEKNSE